MAQTQATRQIGAIRPFRVEVADAELDDLRRRIRATRWPEQETVKDESQGRVAEELTAEDLRKMNAEWANRPCTAHVRVVTLTRQGRTHTRHVLQRLEPSN